MESVLAFLIPLAFLIVFPLFWCGVVLLISRFGWARLADEFGTDKPLPANAQSARFQAARLGPFFSLSQYNNALTIGVSEKGLFLAPSLFLFRPGHPNLMIPWNKIDSITRGTYLWLAVNSIELRGDFPTIHIYRSIGDAVRKRWSETTGRAAS